MIYDLSLFYLGLCFIIIAIFMLFSIKKLLHYQHYFQLRYNILLHKFKTFKFAQSEVSMKDIP
jgi:hypothetical protein